MSFISALLAAALSIAGSLLSAIWQRLGAGGVMAAMMALLLIGTIVHYEGIPFLRDVWLVDKIPGVGPIIAGKIQVKVDEAVAGAMRTFAIQSEMITAAAKATAEKDYAIKSAIVASGYRTLLAKAQDAEAEKTNDLEKLIAENTALRKKNGTLGLPPPVDPGMADILRKQGFRVDQ